MSNNIDVVEITCLNGTEEWTLNGVRHREKGPAFIGPVAELWYLHGKLHRIGGPAATNPAGEFWYKNGRLHRLDGPAVKTSKDDDGIYAIDGHIWTDINQYWEAAKSYKDDNDA